MLLALDVKKGPGLSNVAQPLVVGDQFSGMPQVLTLIFRAFRSLPSITSWDLLFLRSKS